MRDLVFRVVRLMRWWRYDHKRGVWRHRHHPDVSVSSEMLALLLVNTLIVCNEFYREEGKRDVVA